MAGNSHGVLISIIFVVNLAVMKHLTQSLTLWKYSWSGRLVDRLNFFTEMGKKFKATQPCSTPICYHNYYAWQAIFSGVNFVESQRKPISYQQSSPSGCCANDVMIDTVTLVILHGMVYISLIIGMISTRAGSKKWLSPGENSQRPAIWRNYMHCISILDLL